MSVIKVVRLRCDGVVKGISCGALLPSSEETIAVLRARAHTQGWRRHRFNKHSAWGDWCPDCLAREKTPT